MILLGLLLLGATGAFIGLVIAYNTTNLPDYTITMFGNNLVTLNSLAIFISGLVLAAIVGLALMMAGAGGWLHRRRATVHGTGAERDHLLNRRMRREEAARSSGGVPPADSTVAAPEDYGQQGGSTVYPGAGSHRAHG